MSNNISRRSFFYRKDKRIIFLTCSLLLTALSFTSQAFFLKTQKAHSRALAASPSPSVTRRSAPQSSKPKSVPTETKQIQSKPVQKKQSLEHLLPEERVNIEVYEKCNKAVVNIQAATTPEDIYFNIMPREGMGSGVVISEDGYILTNHHVAGTGSAVRATFYDGTNKLARLVGSDPANDIAVLKVDSQPQEKFQFVEMGNSQELQVGRRVLAIGNPFGFDRTMTQGIVSSLERSIETGNGRLIKGIIQTDAAINPGNSGGPLLDTRGKLVGLNTAIFTRAGQSSGIGFAIPVSIIKRIVPELIQHGVVRRPETGIQALQQTSLGLRILKLDPKGPAALAGLEGPKFVIYAAGPVAYRVFDPTLADTITHIDNIKVSTADEFLSYIEKKEPNQVVTLTIIRGQQLMKFPVKLTVTRTE